MTTYSLKRIFTLSLVRLELQFGTSLDATEGARIRGAIGAMFPNAEMVHHHTGNSFLYSYPRVQFKTYNGAGLIVGVEEGCEIVREIADTLSEVRLGDTVLSVVSRKFAESKESFGVADKPLEYVFESPWFALNQENHKKYIRAAPADKRAFLDRNIASNILSMAKGLGIVVPAPIEAQTDLHEVPVTFKGKKMLCFRGTFSVNFKIPDYLGLGKSVSRGFGTVRRIDCARP